MTVGDVIYPEAKVGWIYALLDEEEQVFYVGKAVNPQARIQGHATSHRHGGRLSRMVIIDGPVDAAMLMKREREWIRRMSFPGHTYVEGTGWLSHPGLTNVQWNPALDVEEDEDPMKIMVRLETERSERLARKQAGWVS